MLGYQYVLEPQIMVQWTHQWKINFIFDTIHVTKFAPPVNRINSPMPTFFYQQLMIRYSKASERFTNEIVIYSLQIFLWI